jgi:hypothetical protein
MTILRVLMPDRSRPSPAGYEQVRANPLPAPVCGYREHRLGDPVAAWLDTSTTPMILPWAKTPAIKAAEAMAPFA